LQVLTLLYQSSLSQRELLSDDAARTVVCAIVAGRLDYCNAVLYSFLSMNIDKLQRVQNTLARVVSKTNRRDHITPVLADLHWLPLCYKIEYKIALLTYKVLTIKQPQYSSKLIRLYETPRQLRFCGAYILQYSPAVLNFLGVLSAILYPLFGTVCPKLLFLT